MPVILQMVVNLQARGIFYEPHFVSLGWSHTSIFKQCADLLKILHILLGEYPTEVLVVYPQFWIDQLLLTVVVRFIVHKGLFEVLGWNNLATRDLSFL